MPAADLSEFLKLSKPKRPPCSLGIVVANLDAKDRAALEAALATDQGIITNAAISQWFKARDLDVHPARVLSHRKQTCNCPRDE